MKSPTIAVIGGTGLFGRKLYEVLNKESYSIHTTYYSGSSLGKDSIYLDIRCKKDVFSFLKKINPSCIIHTAAYTDVDGCEKNNQKAFSVNVDGTRHLAEAAELVDAKFVYISTDYVFDGEKGCYQEEDDTNPLNYYGVTKLQGEKMVREVCSDWLILRTSVLFGLSKQNFALWILNNLRQKKHLRIVDDQYVSPTLNSDLSEQVVALFQSDEKGIFHASGGERVSRFDFGLQLCEVFDLDFSLITAGKMHEMPWVAQRPRDSSLAVSKVSKFKKPYKLQEALNVFKEEVSGIS